jgi:hypothetical protein
MCACADLYSWRARFSQVPKDWEQMLELLEMYFFILDKKIWIGRVLGSLGNSWRCSKQASGPPLTNDSVNQLGIQTLPSNR